jgi:hypothetical protein
VITRTNKSAEEKALKDQEKALEKQAEADKKQVDENLKAGQFCFYRFKTCGG